MKPILKLSVIKKLVWISMLMIVSVACHRDKKDVLGPGYIMAPEGFGVTTFTATPSPVVLAKIGSAGPAATGPVIFNATFTHSVTWVLTIRGQKSGAVHAERGVSAGLSNLAWNGIHDELNFFVAGETATATLSFFGTNLTASTNIDITVAQNYRQCGLINRLGTFDDTANVNSVFIKIEQPGVALGTAINAIDLKGNVIPSVQDRYYMIKGKNTQNDIFVAGVEYRGTFAKSTYYGALSSAMSSDPNEVWMNIYIYGTGDAHNTINIEMKEDDELPIGNDYQPASDDAYIASVKPTHIGWKLFSFRYSNIPVSTSGPDGGNGNKIQEPLKLKYVTITLLKDAAYSGEVEAYFDYPIITIGGPFKPCL